MGKFESRAVLIDIEPWGELIVRYDCNIEFWFKIRPNSFLSRFGFLAEGRIFTDDREFDQNFVVRSNNFREVSTWLMNREIRERIFTLAPFSDLAFNDNLLRYISTIQLDHPRTDEVMNKLKTLHGLAASLESQY